MTTLERAHADMIAKLASIKPPRISARGDADEFGSVKDYVLALAAAVDPVILAAGQAAKECAPAGVAFDLGCFRDQLLTALDGNATFELDRAGNEADAEYVEEFA